LKANERLQVFLTNTLEPIEPQPNFFLPALAAETEAAHRVKQQPILVITGNPPYAGHSKNKGTWITASIAAYRKGFPELSKPAQGKWLQDDYVKFIRFAQMKMEEVEEGVVAIITNHSWLDNPTFKGMRKSLAETFDRIYVFDLHGNAKKKERTPDGGKDENIFDIEQGVAISLLLKRSGVERGVWHADLWGERISKYKAAAQATLDSVQWEQLAPGAPDWLFKQQDAALASIYREFWSVPAILARLGDPAPGIVTTHDEFAVSFTREETKKKIHALLATKDEQEARQLFRLCSQSQWSYQRAKVELRKIDLDRIAVDITYRPFDKRWTIWDRNVAVHRRERVMNAMLKGNLALLTARPNRSPDQDQFFVSDRPSETKAAESTIQSYCFPLWISAGVENLAADFRAFLDGRYEHHYRPEEIFGYIYAVLHAPSYRTRYAEFLRGDFPRIPFAEDADDFETLSALGWAVVQAHLLHEVPRSGLADFHGRGDRTVDAVRYSPAEEAVWINKTQNFAPVPDSVWEFHIGGYQVLNKYLKARKGRVLALDEINHVSAVADSLAFTIEQMAKIDTAYWSAFPDSG